MVFIPGRFQGNSHVTIRTTLSLHTSSLLMVMGLVLWAPMHAQQRADAAAGPVKSTELTLTASSASVRESGRAVKIQIFRWSTDEERTPMMAALNLPPPPHPRAVARAW